MPSTVLFRRAAAAILRPLIDRRARSEWLTRIVARGSIHQDVTQTWPDRYPWLFTAARDLLGDRGQSILSFGCSSGEEVMSLRGYFPGAAITGAELNRAQLAACRRLPADAKIAFIHSTRRDITERGPYDAIFCMAVLQRRPHTVEKLELTNIARYYPFARFADEIAFLTDQLRPGGLLVVEHCQYRVEDVVAMVPLEPVVSHGVAPAKGPRFDRDGALIDGQPIIARIFRRASP